VNVTELRQLNAAIKIAWPGQGWPDLTVRAVAGWFADVESAVATEALGDLFRDGREFPPQPSTLLARVRQLQEESTIYLPPPDSCREADPDERVRMERWRPLLRAATERHLHRQSTGNPPEEA
jgi:hypothetical protein